MFKDLLIKNANITTPTFIAHVWDEKFEVEVNKFKSSGIKYNFTEVYDTEAKKLRKCLTKERVMIPDYRRFKLWTATGLVHALDSIVMNKILKKFVTEQKQWAIGIHDAVVYMPGNGRAIREEYASLLTEIYDNREEIIENYRQSIGANTLKADIDYMKLTKAVHPISTVGHKVRFKRTAMK